jgi:hypothetical protein
MNGKEALPHSWPYAISIAFEGPKGKLFQNLLEKNGILLIFFKIRNNTTCMWSHID